MSVTPLTHRDFLELTAPFSRRGRRVDLAASDRMARRLLFRPVDHPGDGNSAGIREVLQLERLQYEIPPIPRALCAAQWRRPLAMQPTA